MYKDAQKGDLIKNIRFGWVCNVVEVSDYWGWFKVRYTDGKSRIHRMGSYGTEIFTKMTQEEIEDFYSEYDDLRQDKHWSSA